MGGPDGMDIDFNLDAGFLNGSQVIWKTLFVGFPTQKSPKQSHVRTLPFVRSGKGAIGVKLHIHLLDIPIHQVAAHPSYSNRCSTMRARGASHDRADYIIKYAWVGFHFGLTINSREGSKT